MDYGERERLTPQTVCSAILGIVGTVSWIVGAIIHWGPKSESEEVDFGIMMFIVGILLYIFHLGEALGRSKTAKYLSSIMSEKEFQEYVDKLQVAAPGIRWTIQNYHYEERKTKDKDGKERVERKRVNTHRAEQCYDIKGVLDETLSPQQMLAMFHLLYDGEDTDLEANKSKSKLRGLFLLCEMPLEYHPVDDTEYNRLAEKRQKFYNENHRDTHIETHSTDLIDCHYHSHDLVILREGTDDSRGRPCWMQYWFFAICCIFLLSLPFRVYFFSKCRKTNWEVLKHYSHQPKEMWAEEPQQSRVRRTDAASKAFQKVKRETPQASGPAVPAWEAQEEELGPAIEVPGGVPSYWKNQDLSQPFDEKIKLSKSDLEQVQKLLDLTFKARATRDRKDAMPSRLLVTQVLRIEDRLMWQRFASKRLQMAKSAPKRLEDLPGSGPVKTWMGGEAPDFLKELSLELNEAFLFHGSCPGGALGIGEDGFDMSRVGSNVGTMFGGGAYLAEASSKSDEYATEDPSGFFKGKFALLLCRSLLGSIFYITESNIPRIEDALATGRFHCVLGDREAAVDTYREFVIFDEAQIYPEYVVIYERSFEPG